MNDYWWYVITLAVIIIASLAFYAGKLLRELSKQQQKQLQTQIAHKKSLAKHDHKVLASVQIITRAMQEQQCDFSEGCWRLSVLISSLKMSSELELQFPAIFKLYNEIKDLTILDERKQLEKKQRMKEDYKRLTVEAQLHDEIVIDLDLLQQYTMERMAILKV